MRNNISPSSIGESHPDFQLLRAIYTEVCERGGGLTELYRSVGAMFREAIDAVIDTPHSGRWRFDQLEKTEKTYLGTRVEIRLRSLLRLSSGRLDLHILGHDVDVKFTTGETWMIPREAFGQPCLVLAADEVSGLAYFGVVVAREEYLSKPNRDGKRSIRRGSFDSILWFFQGLEYPRSFWISVEDDKVQRIFAPRSGTARLFELFFSLQNRPIDRSVIADVAQQKDYMKRLRANGGVRDKLDKVGLELLSGKFDKKKIEARKLPPCSVDEFICKKTIALRAKRLP